MTITPGQLDLQIYCGEEFSETLVWTDANNTAINLNGCTAEMQARFQITDASPFLDLSTANGGITITPSTGTLALYLSPAATSSLPAGVGLYDLHVTFSSASKPYILQGKITVNQMVTV